MRVLVAPLQMCFLYKQRSRFSSFSFFLIFTSLFYYHYHKIIQMQISSFFSVVEKSDFISPVIPKVHNPLVRFRTYVKVFHPFQLCSAHLSKVIEKWFSYHLITFFTITHTLYLIHISLGTGKSYNSIRII